MGEFRVLVSRKADKTLQKLDAKMYERVMEALTELEGNPVPVDKFDASKIKGTDSCYRIRIRRHRILYEIKWEIKEIEAYDIDRKDDHPYD